MRSLLLLPSLRSDAFVQFPDLTLDEAVEQITAFQAQTAQRGKADRVAEAARHIAAAPASERRYGDDVQVLGPVDIDTLPIDMDFGGLDADSLRGLTEVCEPGLSGRRAVFVTVDELDRATVLLGTQVSFNENRYTRGFWDRALSERVAPEADASFSTSAAPSAADDLNATATELRDIAGALRKRGTGSLFGTAADPELLGLASRLDAVVVKLVGEPPKVDPTFDVDQVIERGREMAGELFKKGTEVTGDLVKKGDEAVKQVRSVIADILSGRKP